MSNFRHFDRGSESARPAAELAELASENGDQFGWFRKTEGVRADLGLRP